MTYYRQVTDISVLLTYVSKYNYVIQ